MLRGMTDTLHMLDRLRSEAESLFGRAETPTVDRTEMWAPRVDIRETDDEIRLETDLPGLRREDVEIELGSDSLTISGERKLEKAAEGESLHRVERVHGPFSRSFSIGVPIDPEKTSASLRDGVLHVTIAKAAEAKPRTIEIETK